MSLAFISDSIFHFQINAQIAGMQSVWNCAISRYFERGHARMMAVIRKSLRHMWEIPQMCIARSII